MTGSKGRGARILVVEDARERAGTCCLVRATGEPYEIDCEQDVARAEAALREGRYDVALIAEDLRGDRTAIDLVRGLVAGGCTTPMILVTWAGGRATEASALAAGAAAVVVRERCEPDVLARSLRDAIERARAAATLHERDVLLRAVFEASHDAIVIADEEARYVDANPAACELFGVTRDELVARRVFDFAPASHRDAAREQWARFLRGELTSAETWQLLRPDGSVRLVEGRARASIVPGHHLCVLRDVTERRRAEAAKARLAAIVDSADDAIIALDLDGTIREWNPGAERIFGCAASEARGTSIARFVPEDRRDDLARIMREVTEGRSLHNHETTRLKTDGTAVDVALTCSALRDHRGDVVGVCEILRDVTETKRLRTHLAIADRMASIGMLSASIAHEINNPLAAVVANVEVAAAALERGGELPPQDSAEILDALRDSVEAARRVRDVVANMKVFSRADDVQRSPVDANRALRATLRMVGNELRHRATVVEDLRDVPAVDANESRLVQVFLNLLVNAAHAIPEGDAQRYTIRVASYRQRDEVVVAISDTGEGIPPERRARVFDPFFTTKAPGVGTGLGLWISQSIVTDYGGVISVESRVGEGTTFYVHLPVGTLAAAAQPPQPTPPAPGPRARVVVVDDDVMVVRVLRNALHRHHDIVGVTDAADVVAMLDAGEHVDVLICDVMMPHMAGMDLYEELARAAPSVARDMIFITGGAFTERARAFLDRVPNERLDKPFQPAVLLSLIAERMRRRERGAGQSLESVPSSAQQRKPVE